MYEEKNRNGILITDLSYNYTCELNAWDVDLEILQNVYNHCHVGPTDITHAAFYVHVDIKSSNSEQSYKGNLY